MSKRLFKVERGLGGAMFRKHRIITFMIMAHNGAEAIRIANELIYAVKWHREMLFRSREFKRVCRRRGLDYMKYVQFKKTLHNRGIVKVVEAQMDPPAKWAKPITNAYGQTVEVVDVIDPRYDTMPVLTESVAV